MAYIAVWYDRHNDDIYKVFDTKENAIKQCQEWEKYKYYSRYEFRQEEIKGWEYFSTAGDDMPKFHVEEVTVNEFEEVEK